MSTFCCRLMTPDFLEDCPQNENLLTNFKLEALPIYEEALRRYGKDDVYICEDAYWGNGYKDETMCSVRRRREGDFSEFWNIVHQVKAEMK